MMHPALMAGSCETSSAYSEAYRVEIADLPPNVYAEAKRLTALPSGNISKREVKALIVKLRRSELSKVHALNSAISHHKRTKSYLAKRGKR